MNTKTLLAVIAICCATMASAQSRSTVEALAAAQPKKQQSFPIDHLVLQPSLELTQWDEQYDYFFKQLPLNIRRTQAGLSYVDNGVTTWMCTPSALPHAQLDTVPASMMKANSKASGEP